MFSRNLENFRKQIMIFYFIEKKQKNRSWEKNGGYNFDVQKYDLSIYEVFSVFWALYPLQLVFSNLEPQVPAIND